MCQSWLQMPTQDHCLSLSIHVHWLSTWGLGLLSGGSSLLILCSWLRWQLPHYPTWVSKLWIVLWLLEGWNFSRRLFNGISSIHALIQTSYLESYCRPEILQVWSDRPQGLCSSHSQSNKQEYTQMIVIGLLGKSWQNAYGIMEMLVGSGVPILNKGRISSFSNARPTKKNWAHGKAKIQGREKLSSSQKWHDL